MSFCEFESAKKHAKIEHLQQTFGSSYFVMALIHTNKGLINFRFKNKFYKFSVGLNLTDNPTNNMYINCNNMDAKFYFANFGVKLYPY